MSHALSQDLVNKGAVNKSVHRIDIHALLADPARRRQLMASVIVATQAREGIVTTHDQALAAYDRVRAELQAR